MAQVVEPAAEPALKPVRTDSANQPSLVETHAHLHFDTFAGEIDGLLQRAHEAGVHKLITVGVNTADSRKAVELAATYDSVWAAVGIHPHEAGESVQAIGYLRDLAGRRKVVAIGECGLDFYRSTISAHEQVAALRGQIELAIELGLPAIFHVREAFEQFFAVVQDYPDVTGVVHSFTGGPKELDQSLEAGLHVALNGIITFTKDSELLEAAKQVPHDRLILETDCPFLSPVPNRGKTNEPARLVDIIASLAELRGENARVLGKATTRTSEQLFRI